MKNHSSAVRIVLGVVGAFAAWMPLTAHAQTTYTWNGGGGDNNWSTNANWIGGVAPVRGSSTFVTFAGSTRTSPFNNQGDWSQLAGMTFASGASGFTIQGNNIGFVNGSGLQVINQNSAATQEINAVFSFGNGQDSRINLNAGDLLVSAANIYIDSATSVRSVTVTGTDNTRRTITFAGNVNKSYSNADPDLYIQANKRVLVTGSLTFGSGNDGSVFIDDGVLQFSGAGTMTGGRPVIGNTSGSGNAAVWLDTAGATFAQQLELRNGSSGRRTIGGLNTSGTVTFSNELMQTSSAPEFDLAAATGGTVVFSGQRTATGTMNVNRADGGTTYGGTVEVNNATNVGSTATVVSAGTLRVNDTANTGTGTLRGSVTVNAGATLALTGEKAALGWQSGASVTSLSLGEGSLLTANKQHIWLAGGTVSLTGAKMQTNGGVSSGTTDQYFEWGNSPVATLASSVTSEIAGRIRKRGDANPYLNFTVADGAAATDLLVSAAITDADTYGSTGITKSGAGTMTLSGSNSFTQGVLLYGGVLEVSDVAQLGTGGFSFEQGTGDSGTLRYTGGSTSSTKTLWSDKVGQTRAAIDVAQAGTTLSWTPSGGGVSRNLTKTGAGTLVFGGAITGTGGNVAVEAGTLVLTASNSYSGGTNVVGGVLEVSDLVQTGTGYLEFNAASGDSGTLRYTGGSATTTKTLWIDNPGITRAAINITQAGSTLTWNPGGGVVNRNLTKTGSGGLQFGGVVSGSATVGVEAGTLLLTASNSYAGGTTITSGTLEVSAGGAAGGSAAGLGTGSVSIGSGGQVTYWLSTTGSQTIANSFSLSGGTLYTADGANTFSGPISLASGASTISAQWEDTITLAGGLAGNGNVLFTQAGGTTSKAAPTYVLSGTGANTGTVRVSGSSGGGATKLQLANVNALQSATLDLATGDVGTVEFTVGGNNTYALGGLQGSRNLAFGANSLSVGGNSQSTTYSGNLLGSGAFTKAGNGTLTFSGTNTSSGATTISAGILAITSTSGLQGTSGVSIAGGAGLAYTGGTATFGKNITVTSGTGSVTNSGGGLLTLSGTLTKNGTVLRLAGGAFNVTGSIVGSSSNSDLIVAGTASVTLSAANTYVGPTFVIESSTLAYGINNAIPSNSVVTLGNASSQGTLNMNGFTGAIGGLAFGSGGGTLRVAATSTSAAPLTAATGTMTLTNGTLDLAGSGSTAGLYRVLSAQSIGGSFASITGTSAAYQVITSATSVDYQQRAVLGAVTVTSPAVSIITGGSAAFTYTVANSALSGGASLGFSSGSLSANLAGSSSGTAAAGGPSGAISGLTFTGTTVGTNRQGTFTVSAPTAFGATTATGTVAVTVLDHATSSLASGSTALSTVLNLGTWDYRLNAWTSGTSAGQFSISNLASSFGASLTADLSLTSVSGTGNGFTTNLNTYTDIAGGSSRQYSVFVDPTSFLTSGTQSWTFTIAMGDKTGLSGGLASNTLSVTANVAVVPEPSTIAMALVGLACGSLMIRRRRGVNEYHQR